MEFYVWWRVAMEQSEAALVAATQAQQRLRAEWPGIEARLLVRDESGKRRCTVMEVYRGAGNAGSPDRLALEAIGAELGRWAIDGRQLRPFGP